MNSCSMLWQCRHTLSFDKYSIAIQYIWAWHAVLFRARETETDERGGEAVASVGKFRYCTATFRTPLTAWRSG